MQLSIIIPVYKSGNYLEDLCNELIKLDDINTCICELIFIVDASPDGSFGILLEKAKSEKRMKVISLKKNIGQYPATWLGIYLSSGDYIITLDADAKDLVKYIPVLISRIAPDRFSVAYGILPKKNSYARNFASNIINWLYIYTLTDKTGLAGSSFRAFSAPLKAKILAESNDPFLLDYLLLSKCDFFFVEQCNVIVSNESSYSNLKIINTFCRLFYALIFKRPLGLSIFESEQNITDRINI